MRLACERCLSGDIRYFLEKGYYVCAPCYQTGEDIQREVTLVGEIHRTVRRLVEDLRARPGQPAELPEGWDDF